MSNLKMETLFVDYSVGMPNYTDGLMGFGVNGNNMIDIAKNMG